MSLPYRRALVVALLLCGGAQAHAADICKWTDENGRPQFGDCRLAPAKGAKVDVRPASGNAPERLVTPARAASPASAASAPITTKFPPPGTPAPVGWTSTCEKLAQRISDLPPGTPFQSESNQILQGCPGIAYHCEFRYEQPEFNRCGPIAKTPGQPLVSNDYYGYPKGVRQPTYRDLQAR